MNKAHRAAFEPDLERGASRQAGPEAWRPVRPELTRSE
jgi:hypothetical protein